MSTRTPASADVWIAELPQATRSIDFLTEKNFVGRVNSMA